MQTIQVINGELKVGDWVIAALNNNYRCLLGKVKKITIREQQNYMMENESNNIFIDFTTFRYPHERIAEIEDHFGALLGEPKHFSELELDNVIMEPTMLIRITELGFDEITRLGKLQHNCEVFCRCFPGGGEPLSEKHRELLDRIDKNLSDFNSSLMELGKRELIEMANEIARIFDVYAYMSYRDFNDCELNYFLQFQNPLETLADRWRNYYPDIEDEKGFVFDSIVQREISI